jgi:hypothetical protein
MLILLRLDFAGGWCCAVALTGLKPLIRRGSKDFEKVVIGSLGGEPWGWLKGTAFAASNPEFRRTKLTASATCDRLHSILKGLAGADFAM